MNRKVVTTRDGTKTIRVDDLDVFFHSMHGAIRESEHVYVNSGLSDFVKANPTKETITIFEVGFGTGLNALLTYNYGKNHCVNIDYHTIEPCPLEFELVEKLNYIQELDDRNQILQSMHNQEWEVQVNVSGNMSLTKEKATLQGYSPNRNYDIVYYDAFAPSVQPELWTASMFKQLYDMINEGGVLVTYCSKSNVRRAMLEVGFNVEKLQGPPGKREMLKANKV